MKKKKNVSHPFLGRNTTSLTLMSLIPFFFGRCIFFNTGGLGGHAVTDPHQPHTESLVLRLYKDRDPDTLLWGFFCGVKPSSYSRTTYTDGRGDDGENTKAEARGLRAQPRAARVQHTRAQAET